MVPLKIASLISLGFIVYYLIFQVFSDFMRAGMATHTVNKKIAKFMTDYNVNVRTFQKNNTLRGFAWFKTIWINENQFKKRGKTADFVLHHEYYHLKHKHKHWILTMRFIFALLPLSLSVLPWYIFVVIFLIAASLIEKVVARFEKEANDYAFKMIGYENKRKKGKDNHK